MSGLCLEVGSLVTEEAQIQAEALGKGDGDSETQKWCEMGRMSYRTGRTRRRRHPDNTLVLGEALTSREEGVRRWP